MTVIVARKRLCADYGRGKEFHRTRSGSPIENAPLQLIDRLFVRIKALPTRKGSVGSSFIF
jgi:hypothetical protein